MQKHEEMASVYKHVYSTSRTLYVLCNIGARSRNTCCRGKEVSHILSVCSLRYPACKEHAPYGHLWPVWLYSISTSSHERNDYQKKKNIVGHKMCFDFLYIKR